MQSNTFNNIKKILIIRLSSIGDIVLTTELVRSVKQRYPNSDIHYLVSSKFKDILTYNPYIDKIIEYDKQTSMKQILKKRDAFLNDNGFSNYDLIIDLQNNIRSTHYSNGITKRVFKVQKWRWNKIQLVRFKNLNLQVPQIPINYLNAIRELEINSDGNGLEFWFKDEKKYKTELNTFIKKPIVGVAPGAHHKTKRFPAEMFADALNEIKKELNPQEIRVFGSKEDQGSARLIQESLDINDFTGKLSILETAEEIDKCGLFLTNDTGLMHIAASRKVPVVAIFGSTVTNFGFSPYGTSYKIIENKQLNCRPCSHIGKSECPKKHFKCMLKIDIKEIVKNALELTKLQ